MNEENEIVGFEMLDNYRSLIGAAYGQPVGDRFVADILALMTDVAKFSEEAIRNGEL